MSKNAPQRCILTANRLADGKVIFLDFEGAWAEALAEALVAHTPDEIRALEDRGAYDAARNLVVEPYLVEVREIGGRIEPLRYRERVRVAGPTVLEDVPGYAAPSAAEAPMQHDRAHSHPVHREAEPATAHNALTSAEAA